MKSFRTDFTLSIASVHHKVRCDFSFSISSTSSTFFLIVFYDSEPITHFHIHLRFTFMDGDTILDAKDRFPRVTKTVSSLRTKVVIE